MSGPQHVTLSVAHAVYLAFQFFIRIDGIQFYEVLVALGSGKSVLIAVFGVAGRTQQMLQYLALQQFTIRLVMFQFTPTAFKYMSYNTCYTHLNA